jgi:2-methylfumaryl-CoA isomerase
LLQIESCATTARGGAARELGGFVVTSFPVLADLRVVEAASFVAAPSCAMHLGQLGAEVIRLDPLEGGPDFKRWPQSSRGDSFFWEGLNKGKKSVALDLRQPEGRELAIRLITADGEGSGLFVTNYPAKGFLAHERLTSVRADLITLRIMGHADGRSAVDYTINPRVGLPMLTGPEDMGEEPVNHVLPAWDLLAGMHGAFALLAAERHRRHSGVGQELRLPLADVAWATVGNLGQIAEASEGFERPRYGNALYGAFGRDFQTADGRRIMIVGLTAGQWKALINVLGLAGRIAVLEQELALSFATDEGLRFRHRERLFPLVAEAVGRMTAHELEPVLEAGGVCWAPYRSVAEALAQDPELSSSNPLFTELDHPSGARYLTPGLPTDFGALPRLDPVRAPRLGEHTEEILTSVLGLGSTELSRLHDSHIIELV